MLNKRMTHNKNYLFATTALTASVLTGCAHTFISYQDTTNLSIKTDNDLSVQKACPQLSYVKLVTANLADIPNYHFDPTALFSMKNDKSPILTYQDMNNSFNSNGALLEGKTQLTPAEKITTIAPDLPALMFTDNLGGSIPAFSPVILALENRKHPTVTYSENISASFGFLTLISGDWRFINSDTVLMTHPIKFHKDTGKALIAKSIPKVLNIFNDNAANLRDKADMLYQASVDAVKRGSKPQISYDCAFEITDNQANTILSPEGALKLGFVDAIINKKDNTITYRFEETREIPEWMPIAPPFLPITPNAG